MQTAAGITGKQIAVWLRPACLAQAEEMSKRSNVVTDKRTTNVGWHLSVFPSTSVQEAPKSCFEWCQKSDTEFVLYFHGDDAAKLEIGGLIFGTLTSLVSNGSNGFPDANQWECSQALDTFGDPQKVTHSQNRTQRAAPTPEKKRCPSIYHCWLLISQTG